jgi:MFS family permease
LRDVCGKLWRNAAFRNLFIAFSIWGFFGQGIFQWQPAFFMRSHQMDTGELGTWFAVVQGGGSLIGTYLGGEAAVRYATRNERLQLTGVAIVYGSLAALTAAVYLTAQWTVALALLAVISLVSGAANGPLFATFQSVVPPRIRAQSVALMYFVSNLIGLGLGPLAVGMLSDLWRPALGDESLRYALLAFCPGYLWCAWHFWRASYTVEHALVCAEAEEVIWQRSLGE